VVIVGGTQAYPAQAKRYEWKPGRSLERYPSWSGIMPPFESADMDEARAATMWNAGRVCWLGSQK
jgi:hypothetical protein